MFNDLLRTLERAETVDHAFKTLENLARSVGFEFCAYGLRAPFSLTGGRVEIFSNYPPGWQDRYHNQNYLKVDPTITLALRNPGPVLWADAMPPSAGSFWDAARLYGLRYVWVLASWTGSGTVGLTSFGRSGDSITDADLLEKSALLTLVAHIAHRVISDIWLPSQLPKQASRLTRREVEVLRWTADGKTTFEISRILGISGKTVNFHLQNSMSKLESTNKTQAAVKASVLGIIA